MSKFDFRTLLLVLAGLLVVIPPGFAESKQNGIAEQINIDMRVHNSVTGGVVLDTLTVDLLMPDSTLIYSRQLSFLTKKQRDAYELCANADKCTGKEFHNTSVASGL